MKETNEKLNYHKVTTKDTMYLYLKKQAIE